MIFEKYRYIASLKQFFLIWLESNSYLCGYYVNLIIFAAFSTKHRQQP